MNAIKKILLLVTLLHASHMLAKRSFTINLKHTTLAAADLDTATDAILTTYDQALVDTPSDITFAVADLKYDHGSFKIVECGNGPRCTPAGHPVYINGKQCMQMTPYWNIIEHALKAHNIPVIFVGDPPFEEFNYLGHKLKNQKYLRTLLGLDTATFLPHTQTHTKKPTTIAEHDAIIVYRPVNQSVQKSLLKIFQKNNPSVLLVNSYSNDYLRSKHTTSDIPTISQVVN